MPGILSGFCNGLLDSLKGIYKLLKYDQTISLSEIYEETAKVTSVVRRRNVRKSQKKNSPPPKEDRVLKKVFKCCFLNGGLYLTSVLVFYNVLLPILLYLLAFCIRAPLVEILWSFMRPLLVFAFEYIWHLPLYIMSKVMNFIIFEGIAKSAYRQRQGQPRSYPSASVYLADTASSLLIQLIFLIQASFVRYLFGLISSISFDEIVPIGNISLFITGFHMCLLNSLYCFEYIWGNMAWPLERRLRFVEKNWPYFAGFGLPLSIITMLPYSTVINSGIYSFVFPIFIISANEAVPILNTRSPAVNIFAPSIWVGDKIVHFLLRSHLR